MMEQPLVSGTLVWYYYICKREVWLMAHRLEPDPEDDNIQYGRFLHQFSHQRRKKEVSLGHVILDIIREENGRVIIGEIKKSSKYMTSARMQLLYYLRELKGWGSTPKASYAFLRRNG